MTCRRSLGPLSSHGVGPLGLRRTQLGIEREEKGAKLSSRTQMAHLPCQPWLFLSLPSFLLQFYSQGQTWLKVEACLGAANVSEGVTQGAEESDKKQRAVT